MARPATNVVPPLSAFPGLLANVSKQYDAALHSGAAFFYPSKVVIARQSIKPGESSTSATADGSASPSVPWTIRCVPALLDKAREKHKKSKEGKHGHQGQSSAQSNGQQRNGAAQQNPYDVFAPPYHPGLLVQELPQHTFLLNKFCVVPKHFLLVTRDFQPQTMPPSPEMLAIAYRMLSTHRRLAQERSDIVTAGKEMLAFYNCGQDSGASQAHQHMQFAELGGETDDAPSTTSGDAAGQGSSAIPTEVLLDLIQRDGKEEEHVHALPLPHQHFVVLLGEAPIDDDDALTKYLGTKLLALVDSLFEARMSAAAAASSNGTNGSSTHTPQSAHRPNRSPSWNLLMTIRAMHLIPRRCEDFTGLKRTASESNTMTPTTDEEGVELVGNLSVNSLGYAGHLLVKSEEELQLLSQYPEGIINVLRQTGVPPVPAFTAPAPSS